jgi:lipopolysaccharide/colanic/teichoic acid biosynthesis glycosyltransferase/anti-anti-sigma regulatory factor
MISDSDLQAEPLIIVIPERLVHPESGHFSDLIQGELETKNTTEIHLDFARLVNLDSSGIGALSQLTRTNPKLQVSCLHVQPQLQAQLLERLPELQFRACSGHVPSCREGVRTSKLHDLQPGQELLVHPSVYSWGKRAIDILGAVVGLGVTAVLLVPIAIAIKLDSPGPIFFRQIRLGLSGKRFLMYKFRSMVTDAEQLKKTVANQIQGDGKFFKNEADPRITRVGRLLRKTSLDEFPQFWHVLRGEMSLVGTRPPTPDEVERYEPTEWQRLQVKPGITGEWQVRGRSSIRTFADVVKLDLHYQQHWSVLYDLHLILQTVLVLFKKDNRAC